MMHPNSLANLQAPFEKGHAPSRVNSSVRRALWKCRKLSPEMVDLAARIARDEREETKDRLRAIEIILSKALPGGAGPGVPGLQLQAGTNCLRIEIVDPQDRSIIDVTPAPSVHG